MSSSSTRSMDLQAALQAHLAWWGLRHVDTEADYLAWQRQALSPESILQLNQLAAARTEALTRRYAGDPPDVVRQAKAETAFYDFVATDTLLPVLYSQRYEYYHALAPLICRRIEAERPAVRSVLDVGCGIGILTSFYAKRFPELSIVGLDRSPASLEVARTRAQALGLTNLRFECHDIQERAPAGSYDLVIASHTLLQSEHDPGLPSRSWETFERSHDAVRQEEFERRTGLGVRLDHLCAAMAANGRFVVFEKARHLGRRVPFQRALASRGLRLAEPPEPVAYFAFGEREEDGPLYVLVPNPVRTNESGAGLARSESEWQEDPELPVGQELFRCRGPAARGVRQRLPQALLTRTNEWTDPECGPVRIEWGYAGPLGFLFLETGTGFQGLLVGRRTREDSLVWPREEDVAEARQCAGSAARLAQGWWPEPPDPEQPVDLVPLYENHTPAAQQMWEGLTNRRLRQEVTQQDVGGRERHVELGELPGLVYLYWANTFDQRQLVIVESARASFLEQYYQECLVEASQA